LIDADRRIGPKHLADAQIVDPFERRSALAANQRVAIAAHQRLGHGLGAVGAVEIGFGLVIRHSLSLAAARNAENLRAKAWQTCRFGEAAGKGLCIRSCSRGDGWAGQQRVRRWFDEGPGPEYCGPMNLPAPVPGASVVTVRVVRGRPNPA
jgi:hypothetical protein